MSLAVLSLWMIIWSISARTVRCAPTAAWLVLPAPST